MQSCGLHQSINCQCACVCSCNHVASTRAQTVSVPVCAHAIMWPPPEHKLSVCLCVLMQPCGLLQSTNCQRACVCSCNHVASSGALTANHMYTSPGLPLAATCLQLLQFEAFRDLVKYTSKGLPEEVRQQGLPAGVVVLPCGMRAACHCWRCFMKAAACPVQLSQVRKPWP